MAKNNDKRAERMARSNRNVNRAITVLMAGVIAEFYLLMVNNYYVKGGVGQVLTMMTVLQVIDYIGCALFGAGLVVWLMRKKWTRFAPAAPWVGTTCRSCTVLYSLQMPPRRASLPTMSP